MNKTAMLPLQRTISSLLIAVFLISGAWLMTKSKKQEGKVSGVQEIGTEVANADTDGDGLKDWEERLWKTSVSDNDTDKDGTLDGEEVSLKRDPSVPGPDDAVDDLLLDKNAAVKGFIEDENLNLSASFGRSILSTYLETATGKSESGQVEAMQVLLAEKLPSSRDYILSDLKISPLKTKESFQDYGNSLGAALVLGGAEDTNELTIIARALDSQDKEELQKLDPIILSLSTKIDAVKKVVVPYTAAEAHLSLLNSLEAAKYDISGMRVLFDDPVLSFLALNSYKKTSDKVLSDIVTIKVLLKNNGAIFSEGQAGFQIFGK